MRYNKVISDKESIEINKAVESFNNQFGPQDEFRDVLIDVLLEILYDIPVPDEKKQESSKNPNDIGSGEMPTYEIK